MQNAYLKSALSQHLKLIVLKKQIKTFLVVFFLIGCLRIQ
jgi:hypothetical protein